MNRALGAPRRTAVRSTVTCLFLLWSAIGPRVAPANPSAALCDQPTSYTSLPDRLELSYEWPAGDQSPKTFLVVVPPGRSLQPQVLEVALEPAGTARTTATLSDPVGWLKGRPNVLSTIFSSQAIGYMRHYRVVELKVLPALRSTTATYSIRRMRWMYPWKPEYRPAGGFRDGAVTRTDCGFGAILRHVIVNADALGPYADPDPPLGDLPAAPESHTFPLLAGGKRPWLRLSVDRKGLHRLDLRTLSAASNGRVPPLEHQQLYHSGRPVPLYLHRDPSRPDDTGELLFYGIDMDSKYTRTSRYWLAEDAAREPLRMAEAPVDPAWRSLPAETSFPEVFTVEQDNELVIHADNFLTISDFRWVWGEIPPATDPSSVTEIIQRAPPDHAWFTSATFSLPGLADPAGQTRFEAMFFYRTFGPMRPGRFEVRINGGAPQILTIQSTAELRRSLVLPNADLRETSNTLEVRYAPRQAPPTDTVYYFDRLVAHYRRRFEVPEHGFTFRADPPTTTGWRHYALRGKIPPRPLVLDVADASRPRVLQFERDAQGVLHFGQKETGAARYRVLSLDEISTPVSEATTDLTDVAAQEEPVDYLIISHRDFIDLLDPLVAVLRAADWRVRVVDVENVYASFSAGHAGPVAIKAFLSHALRQWPGGGPTYVLFVGDCTSDYRGDFRNDVQNFVPTYTFESPDKLKWASEHWYTTLCGKDEYPDVILGRLSVNSRDDAKTVLDKIVRYRTHPVLDPWRARLTYVADRGNFDADADQLRERDKPPAFVGQRLYLDEFPWEDNFYLPPEIVEQDQAKVSSVMTTEILDMFNRGAIYVNYRGHGSPNIWSNERIWFGGDSPNSDIRLMRNGERLPFVVNLTCNSGAIDYPERPWNLSISEDFMRCPTGGAIGLFVPSAPGIPTSHMRLSEEIHHALFVDRARTLGDITVLTKYRHLLKHYPVDMAQMFLFLGEPSCPLQRPAKTFALDGHGAVVPSRTGGRVRVSGRLDLGAGQKGILGLYSPKDEIISTAPIVIAPDGRFEHVVALDPTDEPGTWTVRAYCWNDATQRDAVGWAGIAVVKPDVALTRFEMQPFGKTVGVGDTTSFTCVVTNRSRLSAKDVELHVYRQPDRRVPLRQNRLSLDPGETRTVQLAWQAEAGVHRLVAEISGSPGVIGRPALVDRSKFLDLAVTGSVEGGRLEIVPQSVTMEISRAGNRYLRRTELSVGSIGTVPPGDASIVLADDTGTTESRKLIALPPGKVQTLKFQRLVDTTSLPREHTITLRYRDPGTSQIVERIHTERVQPEAFPDLVVLAEGIRFSDDTNALVFGDPTPTDGQTVFIDVPVKNIGRAPVERAFLVEAIDGAPQRGGLRLRNGVDPAGRQEIAHLDPGEVKTLRFRWDPLNNAGVRELYFRVDGDQRITEANDANNITSKTLKVLSKGKLETVELRLGRRTFEQVEGGVYPIIGTVKNDGETTLRMVLVEFYAGKEQTPPNQIGEVLLDEIGPKRQVEATYEWKPTPEMHPRRTGKSVTFLARQKGSTRRVTNVPR